MGAVRAGTVLLAISLALGATASGSASTAPARRPGSHYSATPVPPAGALPGGEEPSDAADPATCEELSKEIARLLKSEEYLAGVNPYRKDSQLYEVYNRHMREVLSDSTVVNFIYSAVENSADHVVDFRAFGRALGEEYVLRGLLRLSEPDFQELLRILNVVAGGLSAEECAGMVRQGKGLDPAGLERIPVDDAARYLSLTRKALLAEITGAPALPLNSADQKKIAEQALAVEVNRKLDAEKMALFGRVWEEIDVAQDAELCWAYRVLLTSILELPEEPRLWMIREYANYLRRSD